MSRKNRLNLPLPLKDKFAELLGGKTPTTERLLRLLERKETKPMDQQDVEAGRVPYSAEAHLEAIPGVDPEAALASVAETQARRTTEGRARVADRIADNRARGLDPNAPPEDPAAAALAAEGDQAPIVIRNVHMGPESEIRIGPTVDDSAEIERLKAEGIAAMRGHTDTLERRALQRLPQILRGGGRLRSLEEAAGILVAEMQPNHQDAIADVVRETGKEQWQIVLGALALSADRQELHAGEFDPEWLNRTPGGSRPSSVREQKCLMCGGVLPADARRGASACCNNHGSDKASHTEGCGLAYLEMRQGRWVDTRGAPAR